MERIVGSQKSGLQLLSPRLKAVSMSSFFPLENFMFPLSRLFLPPLFGSFVMLIITLRNLIEPSQNEREEKVKEREKEN